MNVGKYFKSGQKILLRPLAPDDRAGGDESLTVYFRDFSRGAFELELPYRLQQGEDDPFAAGLALELLSDAFGVGIRATGRYLDSPAPHLIRVESTAELAIFQRRIKPRADLKLGLRFSRGLGKLRTFREQWRRNVQILAEGKDFSRLGPAPRCAVNLSASGIRFQVKAPVEPAELFLLLLEPAVDEAPICALAEVVWTGPVRGTQVDVGMRFINILDNDQKRIDRLIKEALAGTPSPTETPPP